MGQDVVVDQKLINEEFCSVFIQFACSYKKNNRVG